MAQKYKIESSVSSLPKSTLNSNLYTKFKEVENSYQDSMNVWLNRKKELDESANNIKSQAEQNLNEYKTSNINSINQKYIEKELKLDEKYAKTQKEYMEDMQNLDAEKLNDSENLIYDSIKKGWRNSSIYDNTLQKINLNHQNELNVLKTENSSQVQSLDFQKELLERQKEEALNNFNIAYAKKLNDQISKLTEEMQQGVEYDYQDIDAGINAVNEKIQQGKASAVVNYMASMSRQQGSSFLAENADELKEIIGEKWYNTVVAWNKTRIGI